MKEITKSDLDNIIAESKDEYDKLRELVDRIIEKSMASPEAPDIIITDKIREHLFHGVLQLWSANREKITEQTSPKQFIHVVTMMIMLEILAFHNGTHEELE